VVPPGGLRLVFGHATLRPWGIVVDQPTLRRPDGSALLALDSLRLRPTLEGLLPGRAGRSWAVRAAVCGGSARANLVADAGVTTVALDWRDVELGSCPPLAISAGALAGRADGSARLVLRPAGEPDGEGDLGLHEAMWRADGGGLPGVDVLHADRAFVRWTFRDGRVTLTGIELHGPELEANGDGAVRLASSLEASALDLRLTVMAGPAAPPLVRLAVGTLPPSGKDPRGPRTLVVAGTLDRPRVIAP